MPMLVSPSRLSFKNERIKAHGVETQLSTPYQEKSTARMNQYFINNKYFKLKFS